jgi:hypothetical protein
MARRRVAGATVVVLGLVLATTACSPDQPPPVPPSASASARVLVLDSFDRTVTDGWGSADPGGPWSSTAPGSLSVSAGRGAVALAKAGTGRTVALVNPQPADVRATLDVVAPDTAPLGGGLYVGLQVRSTGTYDYQCKLRLTAGIAFLSIVRRDSGTQTERVVSREHKVAERVKAGQVYRLTCQASGTDAVHLSTSALRRGAKPGWQVQADDTAATRLVSGGPTGVWTYLSGSAKTSLRVEYEEVSASTLGADPGPAVPPSPTSTVAPSAPTDGQQGAPAAWLRSGSAAPGTTAYPVPADAVHVARSSSAAVQDGSADAPFSSVAAAVSAAPDGSTIVLHRGSYHESVVLPRGRRLTVQAAPREAVWLDGSTVVARWRRSGKVWVSDGWSTFFDSSPTYTRGAPEDDRPGWRFVDPAYPMAAHPDQVWMDGRAQRQVGSRAGVAAGSFYVDEAAHQLVVGSDPNRREVRASTLSTAITVLGTGDVVRGLGVRRYAPAVWLLGALALNVPRVAVSDVVVSDSATTGVSVIAPDVSLTRVTATRNGLMGIHVNEADRFAASGLLVSRNNLEHFNRAPSAGGLKMTRSADVVVRASQFVANLGHGFWCDLSCDGVDLVRSRFSDNTGAGVVFEISRGLLLAGSTVVGNDLEGLWLIDSDRLEVAGNTLLDNGRSAVKLVQDDRWEKGGVLPWAVEDVSLYGNLVRSSGSRSSLMSLVDYTGSVDPRRRSLALGHNVYQQREPRPQVPFAIWTQADGGAAAVPDLAGFQTRWQQDVSSKAVGPAAALVDDAGGAGADYSALADEVAGPASARASSALGLAPGTRLLGSTDLDPGR